MINTAQMARLFFEYKKALREASEDSLVSPPIGLSKELIDQALYEVKNKISDSIWPLDAPQEYDAADDSMKSYYAAIEAKRLRGDAGLSVDLVNHPPHYTSHPSGVECIAITEHMNFCRGNAVKYIWRADDKGDVIENLEKAKWYLDREIARLKAISA